MSNLILAILCSTAISLIMRLSAPRAKNNISMLSVNYFTCLLTASALAKSGIFPSDPDLGAALAFGAVHGILYLASFWLFQRSVGKNGMVLSSVFMKLGLLVPMVVSIFLFREIPGICQGLGFFLAVGAILLINYRGETETHVSFPGLLALLLAGGTADAMSKIFEELGPGQLAEQFLVYTFLVAFLLSLGLVYFKKQRFTKWELFFGVLIGIPNFFSARFLLAALGSLDAVIVYPTYSVATILLITLAGTVLFREKLTRQQWLALGMILLALVLLNL